MLATFIYTECQSSGPFKAESGFKFKSVVVETPDTIMDSEATRSIFDRVSEAFLPFHPPQIDPYMTSEHFQALPKLWVYQDLGDSDFAFTRMFTSGVSNGRPNNPFYQGFVVTQQSRRKTFEDLGESLGFINLRPADLQTWRGWLNPRGDAELEAAQMIALGEATLHRTYEGWLEALEDNFEEQPAAALEILSGYAHSVAKRTDFAVPASNEQEFLDWVSILTHLTPALHGWRVQFTSGESLAEMKVNSVGIRLFRTAESVEKVSMNPWAELAVFCVRNGILGLVDSKIAELSLTDPSTKKPPLNCLPLACRGLELEAGKGIAFDAAVEFDALIRRAEEYVQISGEGLL